MISNKAKINYKRLAGIITENLKLIPDASGRSGRNTLSWYVEEYLLNLSVLIINSLDKTLSANEFRVAISQSNTIMQTNSLATKILITYPENNKTKEYLLTLLVNFEQGAGTSLSITTDKLTDKFDLSSHHSEDDVNSFVTNAVNHISNSLR